jgi:hypothetical protein
MMSTISAPSLDINQIKAEFQAWRKKRVGRERIPEHLWAAAIELLKNYPITTVQKQLLLNLKQLKQRLANSQRNLQSLPKQQFLEIKAAEIAEISGQPHSSNSRRPIDSIRTTSEPICRIAFERNDGSRLTISLPASANIIPAICANLMREER